MIKSPEFFINRKDIPSWIPGLHISEQSRDCQQFWIGDEKSQGELDRIMFGITINGVRIHPWLYFYINHWNIFVDKKASDGSIIRLPQRPDLRDNEWFFNEALIEAERLKKGLIFFGSRRIGKSAFISSFVSHSSITKYGGTNSVVGGSQEDLDNIIEYSDFGLLNVHPFLKYDRTGTDWSEGVEFGTRSINNEKEFFSKISILNVNRGKTQSNQKTAGQSPSSFVMDEIGKYLCKRVFNAARHSFSTPYGWRTCPILMGTSGEIELAADAQDLFNNPEIYNLLKMDWDILNKRCPKPTWQKRDCAHFLPGQMSLECGEKKPIPLAEYLDIKDDNTELSDIIIKVTNWDEATRHLKKHFESLKDKDRVTYNQDRMYLPLDPMDCFLQTFGSPFLTEVAIKHKADLIQSGDWGKAVDVYLKSDGTLGYSLSDKDPAKFPFEGGNHDSPIMLYDEPPTHPNFMDYIFPSGLDAYKSQDKAGTSSLGAFYIMKRMININDPMANCIVASYAGRPNRIDDFYKTIEVLQYGFGSECLMEGADLGYEQYLRSKNTEWKLLSSGEVIAQKIINQRASYNIKYGLPPTIMNKNYLFGLVVNYVNEELGEYEVTQSDGTIKVMKRFGVERIKDIYLLDEIIQYKAGLNVDRIVAFGHALALARYWDAMNYMPKTVEQLEREAKWKEESRNIKITNMPFGSQKLKINPFK